MTSLHKGLMDEPPDDAEEYHLAVGDVMSSEYIAVTPDTTIDEAIDQFRTYSPKEPAQPSIYYVYVVEGADRLVGVVSLRELLSTCDGAPVSSIMKTDVVSVHEDADAVQAALDLSDLRFPAVPVVDEDQRLLGIVRTGTLVDVMEAASSEDMLRMQGMALPDSPKSEFTDIETERSSTLLEASPRQILRIRVPWLIVALGGGLLAGGIIGIFEDTLETVVILAFFIPIVMGMGGNVGTQSSTIFIRGVALGQIDKSNVFRRIVKEVSIGFLIGLIVGGLAAIAAYLWLLVLRGDSVAVEVALVVFGAIVGNSVFAALMGFLIPWLMYLIGQDPAAASNPIVTTIKDVSGLLIYFGLAAILLSELL